VIAYESGVADAPDPFGGSYYLEQLTDDLESGARDTIRTIDGMGGMVVAIERGYPQTEIARASFEYQQKVEKGEAVVVGVNRFQSGDDQPVETLRIDRSSGAHQNEKLRQLRKTRNNSDVERDLSALRGAAEGDGNLMPRLLDAVRSYATLGEICGALRDVFGTYEERPHI
jgi:methylmalonyl-CoA mutase N-terminal domain/subunit